MDNDAVKSVMITGVEGQDGSYLAEYWLSKGVTVYGVGRYHSSGTLSPNLSNCVNNSRYRHLYGDVTDYACILNMVLDLNPHHIYHLASLSHVGESFKQPYASTQSIVTGTLNVLNAVREAWALNIPIKLYHASTSEVFGNQCDINMAHKGMNEDTPFKPVSPYAVAKVAATELCQIYRQAYGLFICNGILFNHESPRRPETFVTKKIAKIAARRSLNLEARLTLGSTLSSRDWGYAPEYVKAMVFMMNHTMPDDYVIATGESNTVFDFAKAAFSRAGISMDYIYNDVNMERPIDVGWLCGDASKAERVLGWIPKTKFLDLVHLMVDYEISLLTKERHGG